MNTKEPTCTTLVYEELVGSNDFRSVYQLCNYTRLDVVHVTRSLWHLKTHKAVDFVSDAAGTWWFATPDTDDRMKVIEQRTVEVLPRKAHTCRKRSIVK